MRAMHSPMPNPFKKPSLSIANQIALMEKRGLVIADRGLAEHALAYISYYRLRAYWFYFEVDPSNPDHPLRLGTTLEEVLALYDFDRRLRLLINDGIERIEVAARGSWAYRLAMAYGPHGYLEKGLYRNANQYRKNLEQLESEISRSHDTFIEHYHKAYGDPLLPPVWMVSEVISFGLLSKWVSALASRGDRQAIARTLGLNERVLTSFLHHLATVRNICAHHGRLWNRRLTVTTILPASPPPLAGSINSAADRQIYNTLVIMMHIMRQIAPQSDWSIRVRELLDEHPEQDYTAMGFPSSWRDRLKAVCES
jgi:abortive infection bacteriophage resistance protein